VSARKILFLHASDEAYGADRVFLEVVRGLTSRGRSAIVVLPSDTPPGWLSEQLDSLGVPVRRLDLAVARRRYLRPAGLPSYVLSLLKARRAIRRLAVAERARVIHVNTSALLVGGLIGRPGGARLLWHVHEIVVSPRPLAWLFRLVPPLTAYRVIAVSDAVRRHLTPGGRFRRKVITIHNGLPERTPAPHEGIAGRGPVVAFVGRLNRWKGHELFVEAVGRLAPRFPDVRFVIAGGAPPGEAEREAALQQQLVAAGVADRVRWLGLVPDGAAVLEASDVAVVPSTWPDPFPTVVLEGMRAGCAVIASDHGGAREMIQPGVSGMLVPPGDALTLADAIARVLQEPGLRERLGRGARERFEREFRVERMVADVEAVYRGLER
jgi:glycosyltransferase involved in cell wall biosynthesis